MASYAETSAITQNEYGKGNAWYVGTQLDHAGLSHLFDQILETTHIESLAHESNDLEITKRITEDGKELYFILNMSNDKRKLPDEFSAYQDLLTGEKASQILKAWDVEILSK
ncbi:Beta-galactosidase C-terminal domain [Lactobacillus intestinalis]|uniref:Beta-galactosidase C-terminal domain n=1 Tax=Lactobacillus intestinalis TaxID=151781 RepID=UPI00261AB679|nr:Beta-galactosidase C-terminal domain [Lactobacillus intestinalis]